MVRDGSSTDGYKPHSEPDLGAPHPTPSHLRAPETPLGTGNLTQELAQLLAATIAHNQAQRGTGGGVPTGADLASLASLMQAATAQRTLAPAFKDGLSALSYSQPHGGHQHGEPNDQIDPHHDDEPMPIPSTWRQPVASESDRWFRQQMGAALLGLAAGLMIVVPAVLWLSGWIGGGQAQNQKVATATSMPGGDFAKSVEIKSVKVQTHTSDRSREAASQFVTGSVDAKLAAVDTGRGAESSATIAAAKIQDTQRTRIEELLTHAQRRIDGGDIAGARELLAGADGQALAAASFALAETYDPNMLAAWGRREAMADVDKARSLYDKALKLGVSRAQVRLDGLR